MVKLLGAIDRQFEKLLIRDVCGKLFNLLSDRLMCRGDLRLLCLGMLLLQSFNEQRSGFTHRVVQRSIAAAVDRREDIGFQLFS
jgi:hypothetical protein